MYDALMDHDLEDDSNVAEVEKDFDTKGLDDDSSSEEDDLTIQLGNSSDDKDSAADDSEFEDESGELESWSDDPVRMYLTQMGEIPLLTRQQEITLARQIENTRTAFRRRLLACDYVIRRPSGC